MCCTLFSVRMRGVSYTTFSTKEAIHALALVENSSVKFLAAKILRAVAYSYQEDRVHGKYNSKQYMFVSVSFSRLLLLRDGAQGTTTTAKQQLNV